MPNYRRAFVPGGCWFFTANLLDRNSRLLINEIEALRDAEDERGSDIPSVLMRLSFCRIICTPYGRCQVETRTFPCVGDWSSHISRNFCPRQSG
jgi:hypothetical protein